MTHQETQVAANDKVPLISKLAFGAGDVGTAIAAAIIGFFLLFFFTDVAGISPGLAGLILLISKLWDAVTDPIVGLLSDRTRSRLGRRRPWMLWGAVPFGISFFLLWLVPGGGEMARFWYYLIVTMAFNTAFTVVNVPYTALTPDMTSNYDERTRLTSFRFGFSITAGLIAAVTHPIIVSGFEDSRTGYLVSAAIWSVIAIVPFFFAVWKTYERHTERVEQGSIMQSMTIPFRNKAFRYVAVVYLLSWLVVQVVQNILLYYVAYWLRKDDPNAFISLVILAVQGSALIWLFIWAKVSEKIGKKGVYYLGMLFWVAVLLGLFFVQPTTPDWVVLVLGALAGVGVAVAYLIPWSMLPDVIELNELQTGERHEGSFYGLVVLLQKLGVALALFLVGQALSLAGYVTPLPGQESAAIVQPESAVNTIRWLVGPVPAAILLLGVVVVYFFPITKEQHEQTLATLAERRQAAGEQHVGTS